MGHTICYLSHDKHLIRIQLENGVFLSIDSRPDKFTIHLNDAKGAPKLSTVYANAFDVFYESEDES